MDALRTALQRGGNGFAELTGVQKAVAVIGVVALLVGGLAFSRWASTPSYAPLFSNLAASDASAIVEELNAAGTPYELGDGGATILVPRESVYDLRVTMSGAGLPQGDQTGYSLLDKQGITASEFRQRVDYQRALQGELQKTLQSIDGVEAAVVNLAVPEKDVFADDDGKTTASVLVETRMGSTLTASQVKAVVHLVASSVEGLAPEDVTVADATGKVLSGSAAGGGADAAGDRAEQTAAFEERMSSSLQRMLDTVVGAGHSVVKLTADLDFDATQTQTERFEAAPGVPPVSEATTEETYTGPGGTPVGGVLGPDNIAVPNGAAGGNGSGNYSKQSRTVNNSVGKVVEERKSAPGAVRKLNVAVILDTATAGDVDPAVITQLVTSGVGIDAARGDTVQVSRMAFDTSAQEQAEAQLAEAKEAEKKAGLMGLVKTAGLSVLAVLVLLVGWLSGRRRKSGGERITVELELLEAERAELEAVRERLALEHAERMQSLEAITAGPAEPDRGAQVRDEIGQLVEQQPDEVAQLLRGWLADRRS